MENDNSNIDTAELIAAASDFANYPASHTDTSAKDFLTRFPLLVILRALQTREEVPGLENTLVDCQERLFKTKYGASLIPHSMPFVVVGLGADSQRVRGLACKTVSSLLDNTHDTATAIQLVLEYKVYPLLLTSLIQGVVGYECGVWTQVSVHLSCSWLYGSEIGHQRHGCGIRDEQVSAASMDAIKSLAITPGGVDIVFPAETNEATDLKCLLSRSSSLGRVRILALIVKLFSISSSVASVVYNSNLLSLLVEEALTGNDMLKTLSVIELLYEAAEVPHGTEFLSKTTILELLSSIISNPMAESILRSRSMMICGRLLSKENIYMFVDESSLKTVTSAIDGRFNVGESLEPDECECALEALGNIGSSIQGAKMLLSSSPPAARHVVDAAFAFHGRGGKQLAGLHALGNIAGEPRPEDDVILDGAAEESLQRLIYATASKTSKLTPSGLLLSVLQQDSEIRLAGYRLIKGLVIRPWCLMEICSRQEMINIITDSYTETTKIGMEARYDCCLAIYKAFTSSSKLIRDPSLAAVAAKLQEVVKNGPYLARKHSEAQPIVVTEDRF
uniref:26S proteasome non-ATPase regulatory subunit 5 n=1 Tax=Daucus carota subsp. sativus TaxID=79200 RepID=A0A164Y2A7_DAUCS